MFKDVFAKLSDIDLIELEMKAKIMNDVNDVSNLKMMGKKIEENTMCLQNLQNKTKENVDDVPKNKQNIYNCKKCDHTFVDKSKLKPHIKTVHPRVIFCHICELNFEKTYQLELHLKSHDVEEFKCKVCDKVFSMRWILQKHESAHELATVKFCHYFNNGKQCPYEEVGCMFNHSDSEKCRFDK